MTAKLNKWTLEIKGQNLYNDFSKGFSIETDGMKNFYILLLITSVYNTIITPIMYSDQGKSRLMNSVYTIIPDWTSVLFLTIFYIILPRRRICFTGISYIPTVVCCIIQTEFNLYTYSEYTSVNSLYILCDYSLLIILMYASFNNFYIEKRFLHTVFINIALALYIGLRVAFSMIILIYRI